jgi:putrescine transport system substrate-binding protein
MLARFALFAAGLWASAALAEEASPFAPPPPPPPKIVRLLAPPAMLDLDALQAFEAESGYQVAYDAYEGAPDLAEKWREGPYDLVVLSGPALAREIAAGALARLDKARLANAGGVRPAALAKLAAYDPTGAYALPLGWYATGLVYAADKAAHRIGGAPTSWNALFAPGEARKMADCGVALPDDRDALFVAAWRLLGVDPARAAPAQVKSAGALIGRSRQTARAFPVADVASALASGAACLSVGDAGEAAAATARSRQGGVGADIRFALPKEGGGLAIEAYAVPRDAPHGEQAHALLDFLLRPEISRRNADAARLVDPEAANQDDTLKRLWPQGAYDPHVAPLVQAEWEQLVSNKETPAAAVGKTRAAPEHKPSTLDKVSKKRRWPPAHAPR